MADRVWEELSRTLRTSAPYKALLQGLGDVVRLPVPAAAWVGELLARDLGRPLLVLVPREADALTWIEAARLFGREEGVVYFPAPSLTPYQEAETSLLVRAQESVALDCVGSRARSPRSSRPRGRCSAGCPRRGDSAGRSSTSAPARTTPSTSWPRTWCAMASAAPTWSMRWGTSRCAAASSTSFLPGRSRPCGSTSSATRSSRSAGSTPSRSARRTRSIPSASSLSPCSRAVAEEAERLADLLAGPGRSDLDWGPEAAELLEALRTARRVSRAGRTTCRSWPPRTVDLPSVLAVPWSCRRRSTGPGGRGRPPRRAAARPTSRRGGTTARWPLPPEVLEQPEQPGAGDPGEAPRSACATWCCRRRWRERRRPTSTPP